MTKRKDGLWQETLTVEERGRPVRKFFYGKTKAEVLRKVAAFEEVRQKGRTFREVAEEWWADAEPGLAVNTLRGYRPAIARAKDRFGDSYIRAIKPSDINTFIRDFTKQHQAADKTVRTQLMMVNLICKYAVSTGDLEANPARDISIPKGLKKESRTLPSDEDIKRVKESINCTFGLFALLTLYTGCRRGESLALTWDDIDFANRLVHITKSVYQKSNTPMLKEPKTEAGRRTVPLLDRLAERLKPGQGLLFPDPKTGGLMTEMHFQRLWKAYAAESGVTATPHQLRHAFATMLFEADVNEKDAQEILGHAQISTTRDIYTHIRDQRRQKTYTQLRTMDI